MSQADAPRPAPMMLPDDPERWGFDNRAEELDTLDRARETATAEDRGMLCLLSGMPGLGKTTLALRWLHRIRDEFPDGALYADLGASSIDGPASPAEVLGRFLRQFGLSGADLPATEEERADSFRTISDRKRLLVLLDDAASSAQVKAVLPSSVHCVVVVTSRLSLDRLRGPQVNRMPLELFDERHAMGLISRDLTAEVDEESLRRLVAACGRLPLALRVAGARLASRGGQISSYVDRIVHEPNLMRLTDSETGNPVPAIFEVTYRDLLPECARAYRLVGSLRNGEFSVEAVAALLGLSVVDTEDVLHELTAVHLIERAGERYRIHALVHEHAAERASTDEDRETIDAALERVIGYWHEFVRVRDVVLSGRRHLADYSDVTPIYRGFEAARRALDDLETERANLLAAVRMAWALGLDQRAWQLCESLFSFYQGRDFYDDWIQTHKVGLAAAERLEDRRAVVRMHSQSGSAHFGAKEYERAREHFEKALEVAAANDDDWGRQSALEWCGLVLQRLKHRDEALERFARSREFVRRFAVDRQARPAALLDLHTGEVLVEHGRGPEAVECLNRAESFFSGNEEPENTARARASLAESSLAAQDGSRALERAQQALETFEELRMVSQQAHVREVLGDIHDLRDEHDTAREHRTRAAEIFTVLGDRRATALWNRLD